MFAATVEQFVEAVKATVLANHRWGQFCLALPVTLIETARIKGYQVEERLVSVEELFKADDVFSTGNAVVLPVRSITYLCERVSYLETGPGGVVSQKMHRALSNIQMGLTEFGGIVTFK
ncbi:branched-chain-amino-acid aminotransferase 5 [Pyrus ussuriensis x Pyrus communis]|uniref:Branched-chain-amino-acid aminotransferase 5 n=1 Tax=Pyrus ussuriensis x Pyrus communis TaxID=2448454 RepID=A0A5N5HNF2_9ROSA|nr:branched-chain-amino-acid aminotransferase 5 [Pyrus ussuriensis x Pyrus communis]